MAQLYGLRVREGCFGRLPALGRFSEVLADSGGVGDLGPEEGLRVQKDSAAAEAAEEEPAGSGNLPFAQ